MWMSPGAGTIFVPDLDEMKKSWRSASSSQKAVRVGLVAALLGTAGYLYVSGRRTASPAPPKGASRTVSSDRGQYR